MGKSGGFLTPKAISNRIKAKGLQKLRWYCQMCQKQCRDENGMKCHMKSEGHLRAMRVFAENPNRVLSEFSQDVTSFIHCFCFNVTQVFPFSLNGVILTLYHIGGFIFSFDLQPLCVENYYRHGTKRVSANVVYQEYIADKHHIHMNSTCWSSLTGFCKHLGKEGKCIVDETEKGWFIQYIDRDPKLIAKKAQEEQRFRADVDEEERQRRMIENQIAAAENCKSARGGDGNGSGEEEEFEELSNDRRGQISFNLMSQVMSKGKMTKRVLIDPISYEKVDELESGSIKMRTGESENGQLSHDFIADEDDSPCVREEQGHKDDGDDCDESNDRESSVNKSNDVDTYGDRDAFQSVHITLSDRNNSTSDIHSTTQDSFESTVGNTLPMSDVTQSRPTNISDSVPVAAVFDPPPRSQTSGLRPAKTDSTSRPSSQTHSSTHNPVSMSISAAKPVSAPKPVSVLESLMREEQRRKSQQSARTTSSAPSTAATTSSTLPRGLEEDRRDHWMHPGIFVKVLSKSLAGGRFYKQKGVVTRVIEKYVGEVQMEGALVRVDQEELQTVLPKAGKPVLIVNGRGRGLRAVIQAIHEDKFNCDVCVDEGPMKGVTLLAMDYEDVSKIA